MAFTQELPMTATHELPKLGLDRSRDQEDPEGIATRRVWGNTSELRSDSSDCQPAWMRMRTPSPENTYPRGRGMPPPPGTLLPAEFTQQPSNNYCVQQPYCGDYFAYKPVLCFMAMSPTSTDGSCQAYGGSDAETAVGSDWRHSIGSLPSIGSWPSFQGAWSSTTPSDDGRWEETHDSEVDFELQCEVCEPCPSSESSDAVPITTENAPSRGSIGHPHSCAAGCKYIKKPRGCKDGADCERCHLCAFRNSKQKKVVKEDSPSPATTASPATASREHGRARRSKGSKHGKQDGRQGLEDVISR